MPPPTTAQYTDDSVVDSAQVPSRIKTMLREGGRAQPALVQAAAEHLLQLGQLGKFMSEADCAALRHHFPQATREWMQGLSATVAQHQRLSGARSIGAAPPPPAQRPKKDSRVRLPIIESATPRELVDVLEPQPPSQPRSHKAPRLLPAPAEQLGGAAPPPSMHAPAPPAPRAAGANPHVELYVGDLVRPDASPRPSASTLLSVGGPRPPPSELASLPPLSQLRTLPVGGRGRCTGAGAGRAAAACASGAGEEQPPVYGPRPRAPSVLAVVGA